MTTVIVSPRARIDLFSIIRYLASVAGPAIADKWDRQLWRAIDNLVDFPGASAPRPRLGKGIRTIAVAPYLIIFRHARGDADLIVLRVVNGSRRITRKLVLET